MAIRIHLADVSQSASESWLKRCERFNPPKVRSTIQRHGKTWKPRFRGRFTIESTRWR